MLKDQKPLPVIELHNSHSINLFFIVIAYHRHSNNVRVNIVSLRDDPTRHETSAEQWKRHVGGKNLCIIIF